MSVYRIEEKNKHVGLWEDRYTSANATNRIIELMTTSINHSLLRRYYIFLPKKKIKTEFFQ